MVLEWIKYSSHIEKFQNKVAKLSKTYTVCSHLPNSARYVFMKHLEIQVVINAH
jgi:hypothetical protein